MKDGYNILHDKYHSEVYSQSNVLDGKFENMMVIYERMYGRYMPLNKDAKIVDLACGAGQFLRYCEVKGYTNYRGVELSTEQVSYIKRSVTENVIYGDAFGYLQESQNHDLIVANDFIEHITKERGIKLVELVYNSLNPGGRILLKTGNMAAFGGLVIWCNGLDHECGYTERSLQALLAINRFKDIRIIPYKERRRLYNWSQSVFHFGLRQMYKYLYAGNYPRVFTKIIAVTGVK